MTKWTCISSHTVLTGKCLCFAKRNIKRSQSHDLMIKSAWSVHINAIAINALVKEEHSSSISRHEKVQNFHIPYNS